MTKWETKWAEITDTDLPNLKKKLDEVWVDCDCAETLDEVEDLWFKVNNLIYNNRV